MVEERKRRGGRTRTFDRDEALDIAMRLFWEHGYEATSLAMLREATGLTPPQIYNAFTDKETLFRRSLDRYLERETMFAVAALTSPSTVQDAIRDLLLGAAEAYATPGKPGGCLFVTGALAASPAAQAIADELRVRRRASEAAIAHRLKEGKRADELPKDTNIQSLAKYIAGVINGMSVQARDGASAAELRALAATALKALPGPPSTRL